MCPRIVFDALKSLAPGGTPCSCLYAEAPPERGIFFMLQVYGRAEISLVKVYDKVRKFVILVCKRT